MIVISTNPCGDTHSGHIAQGSFEVCSNPQLLHFHLVSQEHLYSLFDFIFVYTLRAALTKALGVAYENLRNEEEEKLARGGKQILSSMNADED